MLWQLLKIQIMKTKFFIAILIAIIVLFTLCTKETMESNECYHGMIIGQIRSAGGGVAISMVEPDFSNHTWNNYNHVVEALNITDSLWIPGESIYFNARFATDEEKIYPISADGDESAKPIIYILSFSFSKCP